MQLPDSLPGEDDILFPVTKNPDTGGRLLADVYSVDAPSSGVRGSLISVTSIEKWTAFSREDWIVLHSNSGNEGKASLVYDIEENLTGESRAGYITLQISDEKLDIRIEQAASETVLSDSDEIIVSKGGGVIQLSVHANVACGISIPDDIGWLSLKGTRSMEQSVFDLMVQPNPELFAREAEVSFVYNGKSFASTKVYQKGTDPSMVLDIIHSNRNFTLPEFTDASVSGIVFWSDGMATALQSLMSHSYRSSQNEYSASIYLYKPAGFAISSMKGVKSITITR